MLKKVDSDSGRDDSDDIGLKRQCHEILGFNDVLQTPSLGHIRETRSDFEFLKSHLPGLEDVLLNNSFINNTKIHEV